MLKISTKLGSVVAPNQKLGIDDLKEAFTITIKVVLAILNLIKNFKVQDALALAFQLAEYKSLVPVFRSALAQFADLDVDEAKEIRDHFRLVFNIENDQLELQIEEGITLIVRTYEFLRSSIILFTDWKSYARTIRSITSNLPTTTTSKIRRKVA